MFKTRGMSFISILFITLFLAGKVKGYIAYLDVMIAWIFGIDVLGWNGVNVFLQPVVAHIFIEIRHQLVIENLHKPIEATAQLYLHLQSGLGTKTQIAATKLHYS